MLDDDGVPPVVRAMKFGLLRAALILAGVLTTSCGSQHATYRPLPKTLSTAVWRTHAASGRRIARMVAPEVELLPELLNKADLGIAVSGGGCRAAVATLGQFRALKLLGLLDRARYISSNSGGSWFSGPFVFARPELVPADNEHPHAAGLRALSQGDYDRVFLGETIAPAKLTRDQLDAEPEGSFIRVVTKIDMRMSAIFGGNGSQTFPHVVGGAFLKPFGLAQPDKSFTWSRAHFDRHIAPHNAGALTKDDFYFAAPGRPFLIMNEALAYSNRTSWLDKAGFTILGGLWPSRVPDWKAYWPVESTALYTGMRPVAPKGEGYSVLRSLEKPAGGGWVETFAYGSRFSGWEEQNTKSRAIVSTQQQSRRLPPAMFSLSDAVTNSGGAPGAALGGLAYAFGLESMHWHWPAFAENPAQHEQRRPHVDGGVCDNSGVISLLARGTSRIISLNNAMRRFPRNGGRGDITPDDIPTDVTALFGKPGATVFFNIVGQPAANRVFEPRLADGRDALDDLSRELSARNRSGRPLVVCREYRTLRNDRYDISGGRTVKICWVFLTFAKAGDGKAVADGGTILDRWIRRLPAESRVLFRSQEAIRREGLERFPAFNIVRENKRPQQLSAVQANALAQFTAFCVGEAGPEIRHALGL